MPTLNEFNQMGPESRGLLLAGIYPGLGDLAKFTGSFADLESLYQALRTAVDFAPAEVRTALLYGHPELGLAQEAESLAEQEAAGLLELSPAERTELFKLNHDYRERFGFPFILAVKGKKPREILSSLRQRLKNSREQEELTAWSEIHQIAWFRLQERIQ